MAIILELEELRSGALVKESVACSDIKDSGSIKERNEGFEVSRTEVEELGAAVEQRDISSRGIDGYGLFISKAKRVRGLHYTQRRDSARDCLDGRLRVGLSIPVVRGESLHNYNCKHLELEHR